MELPDLGVGLVCLPGLEAVAESLCTSLDLVEIEPQTYWVHAVDGKAASAFDVALERFEPVLRLGRPTLAHSVGCPVGATRPPDPRQLAALGRTFELLRPLWWSEHMSFLAAPDGDDWRHAGFLLPPLQSPAAVGSIVDRVKRLQDRFGLPFCFETGVNYLRPREQEMRDGDFWGEIADRADCGILLDAHNVWANGRNGRDGLAEVARRLPLERVWEVHVADGQLHKGYWLDSHSGLPCEELLEELASLVPKLPALHAIILEIIPEYLDARAIAPPAIASSIARLRAIWDSRGGAGTVQTPPRGSVGRMSELPPSDIWERDIVRALRTGTSGAEPTGFEDDPGIAVYRDLIAMVRRGTLAETLPLALRYLYRALGPQSLDALLDRFWAHAAAEPFMSDEAQGFARFAAAEVALPHLDEVLAFELAAHCTAMTGEAQTVSFTCEPEPLLLALKHGWPIEPRPCAALVEVTPPARSPAGAPHAPARA